jgi:hypothetical protein
LAKTGVAFILMRAVEFSAGEGRGKQARFFCLFILPSGLIILIPYMETFNWINVLQIHQKQTFYIKTMKIIRSDRDQ